jgi:hypothetical protein
MIQLAILWLCEESIVWSWHDRIKADFSLESMQVRRQWGNMQSAERKKNKTDSQGFQQNYASKM